MTQVEIYQPPIDGTALDTARGASLEDEIREHELVAQRNAAIAVELATVVTTCDERLARLRCSRLVPYPLMTGEEVRVWSAFLPRRYTSKEKPRQLETSLAWSFRSQSYLVDYGFDVPPLSVMETWDALRRAKMFETYEIWTPEVVMPEPILVGYKTFDARNVGPFLIARWGESLEPFETIRANVELAQVNRAEAWRRSQQATAQQQAIAALLAQATGQPRTAL